MTLIATAISRYGVIHAADSNLTDPATGESSKGQKIFGLGFMNGGLAIAGTYDIKGKPMETWMPAFINACGKPTLRGFAESLAERLTKVVGDSRLLLVHIAGYVDEGETAHPELFFVRNFKTIDPTNGAYVGRLSTFQLSEDFWNRDYKNAGCRQAIADGGYQRYFNGYPEGRVAYLSFSVVLQEFLQKAWADPAWRFRPPRSLSELALFVGLEIEVISHMFASSDYPAEYIGGPLQILSFDPPANAAQL